MVNLTVSLPEDTVQRLRRVVKVRYKSERGALSGVIDDALRDLLDRMEASEPPQLFRALQDDRIIAQADTLATLAAELKRIRRDPRAVRILSSRPLRPVARAGLRARKLSAS